VFFEFPHENAFFIFSVAKKGIIGVFCEVSIKGIVQNSTAPIFMCGGPCRSATSRILGIISTCSHIMNYFWAKSFKFKFELEVHKMHFKQFGEKYMEVP
jgi:hypothetical protein